MKALIIAILLAAAAGARAAEVKVRTLSIFDEGDGAALAAIAAGGPREAVEAGAKAKQPWLRALAREWLAGWHTSLGDDNAARKQVARRGDAPRPGPELASYAYSLHLRAVKAGDLESRGRRAPEHALLDGVASFRQERWSQASASFGLAAELPGDAGVRARLNEAVARLYAREPRVPGLEPLYAQPELGTRFKLADAALAAKADPQAAFDLSESVAPTDERHPAARFVGAEALRQGGQPNQARDRFLELARSTAVSAGIRAAAAGRVVTLVPPSDSAWGEAAAVLEASVPPAGLPWVHLLLGRKLQGPEGVSRLLKAASLGAGRVRSAALFEAAGKAPADDSASWSRIEKLQGESRERDAFRPWTRLRWAHHLLDVNDPDRAAAEARTVLGELSLDGVVARGVALDVLTEALARGGRPQEALAVAVSSSTSIFLEQPLLLDWVRDPRVVAAQLEADPLQKAQLLEGVLAEDARPRCELALQAGAARLRGGDAEGAARSLGLCGTACDSAWRDLLLGEARFRAADFSGARRLAARAFGRAKPCSKEWAWAGELALASAFNAADTTGAAGFAEVGTRLVEDCGARGSVDPAAARDLLLGPVCSAAASDGPLAGSALVVLEAAAKRGDALGAAGAEAKGRLLFERARLAESRGERESARRMFGEAAAALRRAAEEPEAQALRGRALASSGADEEAERVLGTMLRRLPPGPSHIAAQGRIDRSLSLARLGRADEADAELKRVIEDSKAAQFRQEASIAAMLLGQLHRRMGSDAALTFLDLARGPENPDAALLPGERLRAAVRAGSFQAAADAYRDVAEPSDEDTLLYLEALERLEPAKAGQLYLDLAAKTKEPRAKVRLELRGRDLLRRFRRSEPKGRVPETGR